MWYMDKKTFTGILKASRAADKAEQDKQQVRDEADTSSKYLDHNSDLTPRNVFELKEAFAWVTTAEDLQTVHNEVARLAARNKSSAS